MKDQPGYMMDCNRLGISDLTLRKLSPAWMGKDQVVTEYRTMKVVEKNALMVWGTSPGSQDCDLYFRYPSETIMVLAETGVSHA